MVEALSDKVPNITFGSNPCRIRYFSQEIVVCREDMMGRMMRNAVRMGESAQGTDLRKAVSRVREMDGKRLMRWWVAGTDDFGSGASGAAATERATRLVGL